MSTKIAWAQNPDGTDGEAWNPVVGCTRVSAGCDHCYASALHNRRYKANVRHAIATEGTGSWSPAEARSSGYEMPCSPQYDQPFAKVQLLHNRLERPLHWAKPRRVFVNSMSDLFHEDVPDEFIDRVFAVMALCPQHTFQILTKRPERMRGYLAGRGPSGNVEHTIGARMFELDPGRFNESGETPTEWPLPNVWLGTSVEDQETADARIPELLATPAAVRWVSLEPQLAAVDFEILEGEGQDSYVWPALSGEWAPASPPPRGGATLDWVVQGGESGAKARPFDVQWAQDMRDQCAAAGVPYFLKQLGARVLDTGNPHILSRWLLEGGGEWVPPIIGRRAHERPENAIGYRLPSRAGAVESEWPMDLRGCRAWPKVLA